MNKISVFNIKGYEVQMLHRNNRLAYTLEHEGKTYGISVEVPSRKVIDIASITFQLFQNALETIEKLNENK